MFDDLYDWTIGTMMRAGRHAFHVVTKCLLLFIYLKVLVVIGAAIGGPVGWFLGYEWKVSAGAGAVFGMLAFFYSPPFQSQGDLITRPVDPRHNLGPTRTGKEAS